MLKIIKYYLYIKIYQLFVLGIEVNGVGLVILLTVGHVFICLPFCPLPFPARGRR